MASEWAMKAARKLDSEFVIGDSVHRAEAAAIIDAAWEEHAKSIITDRRLMNESDIRYAYELGRRSPLEK